MRTEKILELKNIKVETKPKYSAIAEKNNGEKMELNSNDIHLLIFCSQKERWISEISRELIISVKNISVRLERLEKFGLIDTNYYGSNKKYVKTQLKIPFELVESSQNSQIENNIRQPKDRKINRGETSSGENLFSNTQSHIPADSSSPQIEKSDSYKKAKQAISSLRSRN